MAFTQVTFNQLRDSMAESRERDRQAGLPTGFVYKLQSSVEYFDIPALLTEVAEKVDDKFIIPEEEIAQIKLLLPCGLNADHTQVLFKLKPHHVRGYTLATCCSKITGYTVNTCIEAIAYKIVRTYNKARKRIGKIDAYVQDLQRAGYIDDGAFNDAMYSMEDVIVDKNGAVMVTFNHSANLRPMKLSKFMQKILRNKNDINSPEVNKFIKQYTAWNKASAGIYYVYFTDSDIHTHYRCLHVEQRLQSCMSKKASYYERISPDDDGSNSTYIHPMSTLNHSPNGRLMLISPYAPDSAEIQDPKSYPFVARAVCSISGMTYDAKGDRFRPHAKLPENESNAECSGVVRLAKIYGNETVTSLVASRFEGIIYNRLPVLDAVDGSASIKIYKNRSYGGEGLAINRTCDANGEDVCCYMDSHNEVLMYDNYLVSVQDGDYTPQHSSGRLCSCNSDTPREQLEKRRHAFDRKFMCACCGDSHMPNDMVTVTTISEHYTEETVNLCNTCFHLHDDKISRVRDIFYDAELVVEAITSIGRKPMRKCDTYMVDIGEHKGEYVDGVYADVVYMGNKGFGIGINMDVETYNTLYFAPNQAEFVATDEGIAELEVRELPADEYISDERIFEMYWTEFKRLKAMRNNFRIEAKKRVMHVQGALTGVLRKDY